jgi:protocatechuate 3,4-dioxygenase beta subunit
MMLVLAAAAAALLSGAAQAKPPAAAAPAQSTSAAGTARISGSVKNAADDAPLARTRVIATSPALPEPRVALTGADGRYALTDLPAGAYTITATRTGFAPLVYGQGRALAGTPVAVTSGQQLTAIDLSLVAGGVIAGRVLDEDGAPFAGATVDALVHRVQRGEDALFSLATAQTDDRGEFRLFGLPPGTYYVSAADPAFRTVSTPKGVQHYSPTYYPGTPLADEARAIRIGGTTPPPRVELKLQLVPPARIEGQLVAYDSRQLLNGAIILSPRGDEGVPVVALEEPKIFPDGRFSFDGVAPGRYQIRARGQTDPAAAALFAVYSVEVFGADIDGIRMSLRPGAVLEGTVRFEPVRGSRLPDLAAIRVRAPFVDGNAFGDSLTGTVHPGGAYTLRGIMRGAHQIVVDGLPPPWVIKSVSYRGNDITDVQLAVDEREQLNDVRIVITDAASEVSGVVQNPRKLPAANTGVLVCATLPAYWMRTSRRLHVTYTDQNGQWSLRGLPPGEYFAVASPLVDESDLGRRERLAALATVGTPFRVESSDAHSTLTLQVNLLVPATVR